MRLKILSWRLEYICPTNINELKVKYLSLQLLYLKVVGISSTIFFVYSFQKLFFKLISKLNDQSILRFKLQISYFRKQANFHKSSSHSRYENS